MKQGRGLDGELRDPGGGRVDALAEGLPVQTLRAVRTRGHDDLAVEEAGHRQQLRDRVDELREVAREGLRAARPDLDRLAVPGDEPAESVPLRLVEEPARCLVGVGHCRDGLGEHGGRIS